MFKRLLICLPLSLLLAIFILSLFPALGLIAAPFICTGRLEPESSFAGLRFRCREPLEATSWSVAPELVLIYAVPLLALALLFPLNQAVAAFERRASLSRTTMRTDLELAVTARAEILRIARRASFNRQVLLRAAELELILWIQPPNGRPYEARTTWLVELENLEQLHRGVVVAVRINPRHPEAVYPNQPGMHYAWWLA